MSPSPVLPDSDQARRLAALMGRARHTVVFTGAGMSTESGLPDFRSAGGLWKQSRRFEELACVEALEHDREAFVDFYRWRIRKVGEYEPHSGHKLIAQWQARGLIESLITQNVDGFHEAAGSRDVLCLHGTLSRVHCQECHSTQPASAFLEAAGLGCPECGGPMRPSVVLFGEALDHGVLESALEASAQADLFLVLGSSLLVSPANLLPRVAAHAGATLAIINRDPTPLAALFQIDVRASIGPTLQLVDEALRE